MSKQSSTGVVVSPETVQQKAREREEKVRRALLVVFTCFAIIAASMYLLFLQPPRCTPLRNVPGSSVYLFACYPRALGVGDEGQILVTVINDGPDWLTDVKVFLVCSRQLQVGVEVNGSNVIQFDDLDDEVRRTGQVKLLPGEIAPGSEKVAFSLRVTGVYTQAGTPVGSVIDRTLEGGTFPLFPLSVNKALKVFWASVSASVLSVLSVIGKPIWEWLTKRKTD